MFYRSATGYGGLCWKQALKQGRKILYFLKELKIDKVTEFTFVDYEYPRLIIINGKEYDLDGAFDKDEDAGAALYEIDALIGDLVCDFGMKCEQVLKLIEKEIKK